MPPISQLYKKESFPNAFSKQLLQSSSHEVLSSLSYDGLLSIAAPFDTFAAPKTLAVSVPKASYSSTLIPDNSISSQLLSSSPSPYSIPISSPKYKRQAASGQLSSNATVGVVIGCITGFVLLVAVLYVWYLRVGQGKKSKKGKKKNGKKKPKKGKRKKRSFKRRLRKYMRRSIGRSTGRGRRRSSVVSLSHLVFYH